MTPPERRFRAAHYRTGATVEFTVAGDRLVSRRPVRGRAEMVFGPGFFDLQCNGFAGVDFNHPNTTPEQIAAAVRAMRRHGCTHVLPTVVTQTPERMEALFRTLVAAVRLDDDVRRAVPGFHLEGPFISPEDGARGAHPLHAVRPVSAALWRRLQRAAEGMIRLVTLAPDTRGALAFIRRLRSENVVPAIGHTMADAATISAAADAGALLSTHLGNGCPEQMHRHRNPVFAQLGEDRLAASFIADGIHLPPETLRVLARAKGAARTVLVSDAMAAAGAPLGRFTLGDHVLEVGADRVVRQPGKPNFAGSALTMERAVAGFARMAGVPLAEAWEAASGKAWAVLSEGGGARKRSCVLARTTGAELRVLATVSGGRVAWIDEPTAPLNL